MDNLWQDFRFALRTLRKNLWVTILAVTSLSLAIAGNTTVYSLINSFLYRPIPYEKVDRLVMVAEYNDPLLAGQLSTLSAGNFLDYLERQTAFESMGLVEGASFAYDEGGDQPERLTAALVTPGFFPMLGVDTAWGRPFLEEEGTEGKHHVVVLSHQTWTERFGASTDLAGETMSLNGEVYQIVGVLAEDFEWLLAPNTEIWLPKVLTPSPALRELRNVFSMARLADGVSEEAAQAQMEGLLAQLTEEYPDTNRGFQLQLLNMKHDIPDSRNKLFFALMQVALIFVLLIACANIANLLLSRSQAREREIAIRSSIGASRRRITFQLLTESLVMAGLAGAIGTGLGWLGTQLVANGFASLLPSFWLPTLEWRVLLYTLGITVLGGLLFGLAPVIQASKFNLLSSLKDGTQGATSSHSRRLAANLLVLLEIAFAVAFLAGAQLMIDTFRTLQTADPGFRTDNILMMQIGLPESRYADPASHVAGMEELRDHLAGLAGAEEVVVSNFSPRTPFVPREGFEIVSQPLAEDEERPQAGLMTITPNFFEAFGISMVRGRAFTQADGPDAQRVLVINEALAKRFFDGRSPLGEEMEIQGERWQIVGVVETVSHEAFLRTEEVPTVYAPWPQRPRGAFSLTLTTGVEPSSLIEPSRRAVLELDRTIAATGIQSLDDFIDQFWVGQRIFATILSGFGFLALLLAALGTYGVLAYSVVQRRHEIGIRMAIGASRQAVMAMVIRRGMLLGIFGLLLAIPLVLAEVQIIRSIFANFVEVEPSSVLVVGLLMLVVTLMASAIPAGRAASIDPIRALRND